MAAALDARNDDGAIAALRRAHPVTAARDLLALRAAARARAGEKVPVRAGAREGRGVDVPRAARRASLQPDVHVFGHTHFGWDATLDGTRYVQACLAYPRERRDRLTTVAAVCCPADASAPDRDRPCPPCTPFPVAPAPLLLREGGAFVPRYRCGWSAFYAT